MASPARILPLQPATHRWQTLHQLAEPRTVGPDWVPLRFVDSRPEPHAMVDAAPSWAPLERLLQPETSAAARVIPIEYLRKNSIFSTFSDILLDDFA